MAHLSVPNAIGGHMSQVPSWTSGMTFTTEGSYEQQLVSAYAGGCPSVHSFLFVFRVHWFIHFYLQFLLI